MNVSDQATTPPDAGATTDVDARARQSRGTSDSAIYDMVSKALEARLTPGGVLADVGCGTGNLWWHVGRRFDRYVGLDVVRYDGLPPEVQFARIDLDTGRAPLPDGAADAVVAVETIEHLENPRAFVRELTRLARPGGWVMVTTPNQLSLLSLANLVLRRRFVAFKDENYPAHLTALLRTDLERIATECGLSEVAFAYSHQGRMVFTPRHYPRALSRRFPERLSDNVMLVGRKPG